MYAFFSTCLSTCVARTACFVFDSIFLTTFSFSLFFFYKFSRHLCHGAYLCTHNPTHMPKFLFHLHLHFSISCVCESKHVYAFPSSSIFIHIYRHIQMYVLCSVLYSHNPALMPILLFHLHLPFANSSFCVSKHVYAFPSSSIFIHMYHHFHMYMCFDYSVMTPCNLYVPIINCLSVPVPNNVARYHDTCDSMFKGLYLSNRPCLRFLRMHTYHVHIQKVKLKKLLASRLCKPHKKNACKKMNSK